MLISDKVLEQRFQEKKRPLDQKKINFIFNFPTWKFGSYLKERVLCSSLEEVVLYDLQILKMSIFLSFLIRKTLISAHVWNTLLHFIPVPQTLSPRISLLCGSLLGGKAVTIMGKSGHLRPTPPKCHEHAHDLIISPSLVKMLRRSWAVFKMEHFYQFMVRFQDFYILWVVRSLRICTHLKYEEAEYLYLTAVVSSISYTDTHTECKTHQPVTAGWFSIDSSEWGQGQQAFALLRSFH